MPSRSSDLSEAELRLPRPPGVFRRFWARHPLVTDVLIALGTLLFSLTPATAFDERASWVVTVTAFLGCAALLARRRWPVPVFALAVLVQLSFLTAPLPVGAPLIMVALYSVAVYRSSRACWRAFGAACAVLLAATVLTVSLGMASGPVALNTLFGGTVLMLVGALIGVNVGNRRRYLEALIDRSRQLLRERDQQAQLAAAAERTRIAREMHDIVSHSLTVVIALGEGAAATSDADKARAATGQAVQTARDALAQMRTMLGVLRTDDGSTPLAPTAALSFQDAVETARSAGFAVHVTTAGSLTALPQPLGLAVSRIVQEGLTNAMRHAPEADRIEVEVRALPDRVLVSVRNDGVRSGPAHEPGYGLVGLRERAAHLGGALHAGIEHDGWWAVRAVLPRHEENP